MSDLEARQRKHVLFTWAAQEKAQPVSITGGKGVWFVDEQGRRWLDFESQVFNVNLGHGEARVTAAVQAQAAKLGVAHPAAVFEAKAALGEALAAITPGDLDRFFFCLSGAEAVENALKIARMLTGRSKVIARRRSYHGASMGALSLTGDWRRWPVEPGLWGVLRAEDPYCYRCPFGLKPESCGTRCAEHIEHIIEMEGPETIAAVFLEGITGANGGFVPPPDYWPRIREICDRHGILLVADEVFTGFGRTGRWFAVNHWGVVPDMITMAKGLTGGYAPMGAVAIREPLARRFDDSTLWCGLTGYAHPLGCAAAVASLQVYQEDGLIDHAARLGVHLRQRLNELKLKHPLIGDVRGLGLFATIEFVSNHYTRAPLVPYSKSPEPGSMLHRLQKALRDRRVHIAQRWTHLFIAPPLCITIDELDRGIALIDEALTEATEGAT
ncbi:MAG: aminotransferase class III-fold pyridoxal phosphate-dependent enzyme [Myxococcales bacterium]|nr:aminotransferase class III-fold pyridoxal phosphate-dependent enzyme [Myxococcales bacterium]